MICEKYGAPTRMSMQITILGPGEMVSNIKKADFRRGDVVIQGANWDTMSLFCQNPECRHVVLDYGNYVTDLKDDVAALKGAVADAGLSPLTLKSEGARWKKAK